MGTRIALPVDGENVSDILASMLGIMKIGCIADLNGEAEITADFSALIDEAIPCLSPGAFAVPAEPVLAADGQTMTGRELVALLRKAPENKPYLRGEKPDHLWQCDLARNHRIDRFICFWEYNHIGSVGIREKGKPPYGSVLRRLQAQVAEPDERLPLRPGSVCRFPGRTSSGVVSLKYQSTFL